MRNIQMQREIWSPTQHLLENHENLVRAGRSQDLPDASIQIYEP
jgi:hypothetical protein